MAELNQRTALENTGRECWTDEAVDYADTPMPAIRRAASVRGVTIRGLAGLATLIEGAVVPGLVTAHRQRTDPGEGAQPAPAAPDSADITEFTALILAADEDLAIAYVAAWQQRGMPLETTFLDLLAPSARLLGAYWEDDIYSFADVTLGVARLTRMLRDMAPGFLPGVRPNGLAALLLPAPKTQHTFGLTMVAEFMRRAGWSVVADAVASNAEMAARVHDRWFNVVGFSASTDAHIQPLTAAIELVRRASSNRALGVMVGGPLLIAHPDLAALVGADASAVDARHAVLEADALAAAKSRQK
jgi:methanogenic corrinoid protein MtbC1